MVELTNIEEIFNNQAVALTVATDTIAGIQLVRSKRTNPPTRYNTRGTPVDSFASQIEEYTVSALVTKALRDKLVTHTTLNTRFVPPTLACVLTALTVGGSADISASFNARMYDFSSESLQTGLWIVTFTIRVKP